MSLFVVVIVSIEMLLGVFFSVLGAHAEAAELVLAGWVWQAIAAISLYTALQEKRA